VEAAAFPLTFVTAWHMLMTRAALERGEDVLVLAAGSGVGQAAIQIAALQGARVFATAGSEQKLGQARSLGASHVINHHTQDISAEIRRLTGGRGVDVVVEMLANRNLAVDLRLVARRGRIVVVGSRGPVEINPRDAMVREASILGTFLFGMSAAELSSAHAALQAALENGTVRPVIGRSLPLAQAREAHELVLRPGAAGKIVLLP
jgi:NADPH:quinone reductase